MVPHPFEIIRRLSDWSFVSCNLIDGVLPRRSCLVTDLKICGFLGVFLLIQLKRKSPQISGYQQLQGKWCWPLIGLGLWEPQTNYRLGFASSYTAWHWSRCMYICIYVYINDMHIYIIVYTDMFKELEPNKRPGWFLSEKWVCLSIRCLNYHAFGTFLHFRSDSWIPSCWSLLRYTQIEPIPTSGASRGGCNRLIQLNSASNLNLWPRKGPWWQTFWSHLEENYKG